MSWSWSIFLTIDPWGIFQGVMVMVSALPPPPPPPPPRLVTPTPPPAAMVQKREVLLSLTFLGPLSTIFKRLLQTLVHKYNPTVQLKVVFDVNLFSFTDKFRLIRLSAAVYSIHCKNCGPSQAIQSLNTQEWSIPLDII